LSARAALGSMITRDPAAPTKFTAAYDSGDHLHPGDAGYKAMGDAIDLALFKWSFETFGSFVTFARSVVRHVRMGSFVTFGTVRTT
jgi:hypothetical protein